MSDSESQDILKKFFVRWPVAARTLKEATLHDDMIIYNVIQN